MTEERWIEKLKQGATLDALIFRRALRSSIVVFLSIITYHYLALTQGYWVTLTAMVVVQTTVGATLRKSLQRFLGTLCGIIIASLLLLWIHDRILIDILVIIFLFTAYLFNPFNNFINYGLVVIPMSISVVFLIALITPDKINIHIIYARFYDTVLGALLGVLGSVFIFPNKVKNEFDVSKKYLQKQFIDYYAAIMDMVLSVKHAGKQAKAKKMLIESALLSDRQYYLERKYEIPLKFEFSKYAQEKNFVAQSERIAQQLFSLHQIARHFHDAESRDLFEPVLKKLKQQGMAFLQQALITTPTTAADFTEALNIFKKKLTEAAKNKDNPGNHWQEIASLASLHFALSNLTDKNRQTPA